MHVSIMEVYGTVRSQDWQKTSLTARCGSTLTVISCHLYAVQRRIIRLLTTSQSLNLAGSCNPFHLHAEHE